MGCTVFIGAVIKGSAGDAAWRPQLPGPAAGFDRADRQQLAQVAQERDRLVAVEDPEGDEEDEGKEVAVSQGHAVAEMQPAGDEEEGEDGGHTNYEL